MGAGCSGGAHIGSEYVNADGGIVAGATIALWVAAAAVTHAGQGDAGGGGLGAVAIVPTHRIGHAAASGYQLKGAAVAAAGEGNRVLAAIGLVNAKGFGAGNIVELGMVISTLTVKLAEDLPLPELVAVKLNWLV